MRIKQKLIIYLLAIGLVPIFITMGMSLSYTSNQVQQLTLKAIQERVGQSAEKLSSYFSSRISEIDAYAQTPLLQSMDWSSTRLFLRQEIDRHQGIYEKFILGVPSSNFKNTKVGNPAQDGFASFDDSDPAAKLKSIRKRGYWQALVGTNSTGEPRTHVSNPMISYTTGVKQVVVGSSIVTDQQELLGMLGGGIPWETIEKEVNRIRDNVIVDYGDDVQLSLIDSDGIYIYHWNPEKVVHLVKNENGEPQLNDSGEKEVRLSSILEESSVDLVAAGQQLLAGKSGSEFFVDTQTQAQSIVVYAPVRSAGYGLLVTIPREKILAPVAELRAYFSYVIAAVGLLIIVFAMITASRVLSRILLLNDASKNMALGEYEKHLAVSGRDEISELIKSFNTMADDLRWRDKNQKAERMAAEENLRQVNMALEEKVVQRTHSISLAKEQLSDFKDAIDEHSIVTMTDLGGTITYANAKFCAISGYTKEELIGKNHRMLNSGNKDKAYWGEMFSVISSGKTWHDEVRNVAKDGSYYWVKTTIMPTFDHSGEVRNYVSIRTDITENKELTEKISYQASHDVLTGLINRREFEKRLDQLITRSEDGIMHSVLYLDLDEFKVVNDTSGHQAGDELLRQIPSLIGQHTRKADLVARLGGDEFGIILSACDENQAKKVSQNIIDSLSDFKFHWENRTYKIGVSIGIVVLTDAPTSLSEVLKSADSACYAAKDRGRNTAVVYDPSDSELANRQEQMDWIGKLTQCIQDDNFVLYAQPIVPIRLDEGYKRNYEILIRMKEGDKVIPPGAFLPAAERYNKITDIDRWVVDHTFEMIQSQKDFLADIDHVSINLSGVSLTDKIFMHYLVDKVEECGLSNKVCFEVTETAAISNLSMASTCMAALHDKGVRFSLDDFGSGLSSFTYLKNLKVDCLKIDGYFVKDIVTDPIDKAMVSSIHEVGSLMGKTTIAEFVENDEILEILRDIGVDYAQGYGVGRPEPLENFIGSSVT